MITTQWTTGISGEEYVTTHLQKNGYSILARNYKKFYGEIDIIASKDDVIAFIEVKTRKKELFDLTQVINTTKQHKIVLVAKEFISHHNITDKCFRFDVALIIQKDDDFALTYIENAFSEKE